MSSLRRVRLLIVGLLALHIWSFAQNPPSQPKQTAPLNASSINIQNASGSAKGISVTLLGQNVRVLSASLDRQDPVVGTPLPVVNSVGIVNIPPEISNPSVQGVGAVTFPILVDSDPNVVYTLTLWAKSADDPNMDWGTPQIRIFRGYSPAPVVTAPTFKLEFNSDTLNVSVASSEIKTLKAQWQVGDNTIATESTTDTHPTVGLKFAALQSASGNQLPSLILSLEDPKTHQAQESRVTLTVKADQNLTQKVKQARTDPAQKQTKASFSWQDLAKSGAGAILTYFLGAL